MRIKICAKCNKRKFASEFQRDKRYKDGFFCYCRRCQSDYHQKYKNTIKGWLNACFRGIKIRCNNPKHLNYKYYGGRGIKCLFKSVDEFVDYVINELKVDPRGLDIDRIDNDGNYEPGNIRFITHAKNMKNRSISQAKL